MLALLGALIAIYLRLEIGRVAVPSGERWLVRLPFSIYLGWVSVATIANATDVLDYLNWNGWGIRPEIWAAIMLVVAAGLAALMLFDRRDAAFALVVIWAFAGIAVRQTHAPLVASSAWILAGVLVFLVAILGFIWKRRQFTQSGNRDWA
jgi:benzodiazapine receptor